MSEPAEPDETRGWSPAPAMGPGRNGDAEGWSVRVLVQRWRGVDHDEDVGAPGSDVAGSSSPDRIATRSICKVLAGQDLGSRCGLVSVTT